MNVVLFEGPDQGILPVGERTHSSNGDTQETSDGGWWRRTRKTVWQTYERLRDKFDYSERFCGSLRHADSLCIVHSPRLPSEEAEKKLREFLQLSYSKHGRWLAVDGILAGLGAGLFWVPGPNIFFFYPAVRALSHYLAWRGAAKALQSAMSFEHDGRIDQVSANLDSLESHGDLLTGLEQSYNLDNLLNTLKNLQKK